MATDIAMALGVLALIGSRVHPSLKLFLLALAIVDDIGAIVVIAFFYSQSMNTVMLAASGALLALTILLKRVGVRPVVVYTIIGIRMWVTTHEAGIHATITGVISGLLAPTKPLVPVELVDEAVLADVSTVQATDETVRLAGPSVSVVEWLEYRLHPWTSFVIVPLFALANAGISIDTQRLRDAASSRVTLGVIVGLVVGKIVRGDRRGVARGPIPCRCTPRGTHLGRRRRRWRTRRHWVHGLVVHRKPRLRPARPGKSGQNRDSRCVAVRRCSRHGPPASQRHKRGIKRRRHAGRHEPERN